MRRSIESGAAAGLAGGVVSGVLLQLTHMTLPGGVRAPGMRLVAGAVHTSAMPAAWVAYLVYAVVLGALFGWLLSGQEVGEGTGLLWGVLYGGGWWIFSGLVVIPALHGIGPMTPAAVDSVRAGALPWFAAMLLDGAVMGAGYAILVKRPPPGAEADAIETPRAA